MTNAQIANAIKLICKQKSFSIAQMLKECEVTKSFIYDLEKRNTSPSCDKLSKIADYLDCSVDYLLGRTDNPNILTDTYINGNNSIQAVRTGNVTVNSNNNEFSSKDIELLKKINALDLDDYVEMINIINQKLNNREK